MAHPGRIGDELQPGIERELVVSRVEPADDYRVIGRGKVREPDVAVLVDRRFVGLCPPMRDVPRRPGTRLGIQFRDLPRDLPAGPDAGPDVALGIRIGTAAEVCRVARRRELRPRLVPEVVSTELAAIPFGNPDIVERVDGLAVGNGAGRGNQVGRGRACHRVVTADGTGALSCGHRNI